MKEYEFQWPDQHKGYALFPEELEDDPCVLFHGTAEKNLPLIIKEGFKAFQPLDSVSYAKKSSASLGHVCSKRSVQHSENDVVIAVRFTSLNSQGIVENHSDIYVYKHEIQPEIIGFCIVPSSYSHI